MNLGIQSLSQSTMILFQDQFLPALTNIQKKVVIIASIVFGAFVALYYISRYAFTAEQLDEDKVNLKEIRIGLNEKKIAKKNVEILRPLLHVCTTCTEGAMGGYWVKVHIDSDGRIQALEGHDMMQGSFIEDSDRRCYFLDPERKSLTGLSSFEFLMKTADWDPAKNEAFCQTLKSFKHLKPGLENIASLTLTELNFIARKAWNLADKQELAGFFLHQPWFNVMIQPDKYPSSTLIA